MSESKTLTGRTDGNSDGGRFQEHQSKHSIRFSTQSMLIFPSSGHHIGKRSSGGGVESNGCGGGGDGGCRVSSKTRTTPFVVAESGGGGGAESACRVMVDERTLQKNFKPRLNLCINMHLIFLVKNIFYKYSLCIHYHLKKCFKYTIVC